MRRALIPLALAGLVTACGPMTLSDAEAVCQRDARLAAAPMGEVRLGVAAGSDGRVRPMGGLRLDVSSDYIAGRDPEEVFRGCVHNRSGQLPTRSWQQVAPTRPIDGRFF